jgi:NAD(P)H-dependent FMN reductase
MEHISIISSSVRDGRNSHRVALFLYNYIVENKVAQVEIIDLNEYKFPIFDERLRHHKEPTNRMLQFANKIKSSDGIIIVTPEYNGSIPASLKNVVDLLSDEWHHKPVAISTVSSGAFGGSQALINLQFVLWKMHALTVPAMFPIANVTKVFDERGVAFDVEKIKNHVNNFISELRWFMVANQQMTESMVFTSI